MTETRQKLMLVVGLSVLLIVAGVGYFVYASNRVDADIAAREARALERVDEYVATQRTSVPEVQAEVEIDPEPTAVPSTASGPVARAGEVVVVHRVPGEDYGRLAIRHADGERTLLDRRCLRVDIASGVGLCLSQNGGIIPSYTATVFDATDPALGELRSHGMPLPSRARVSPDGSIATATGFISGTSYEDISNDTSTVVTVIPTLDRSQLVGVNQFRVDGDDEIYAIDDRKFWGMSFIDSDEFYVTGLFGGGTPEIMTGTVSTKTLRPTGLEGSCPSLSPDGETLVFKQIRADGGFDLVALDIASGEVQVLNEVRSVDDQVAWLDNETILYALHPDENNSDVQPLFDIYSLSLSAGAEPELFLPAADSPTVID